MDARTKTVLIDLNMTFLEKKFQLAEFSSLGIWVFGISFS